MSTFDFPTAVEIMPPAACDRAANSQSPSDSPFDVASYWVAAVLGVSAAGAAYGLPIFFIGAIFGLLSAGFFSVALVVPFAMAVRAVCGTWRHPLAAPCFGGVIGFVSFAAWGPIPIERPGDWLYFALGPLLASFVGQAGGYIATRNQLIEMILDRNRRPAAPWRFSIWSALIATASLAITLTLLRWWRPLELRDLTNVAIWLPCQTGTLCLYTRWGRRAATRLAGIRAVSREKGGYAILGREARS